MARKRSGRHVPYFCPVCGVTASRRGYHRARSPQCFAGGALADPNVDSILINNLVANRNTLPRGAFACVLHAICAPAPGMNAPSVRAVARRFGVSDMYVRKTLGKPAPKLQCVRQPYQSRGKRARPEIEDYCETDAAPSAGLPGARRKADKNGHLIHYCVSRTRFVGEMKAHIKGVVAQHLSRRTLLRYLPKWLHKDRKRQSLCQRCRIFYDS